MSDLRHTDVDLEAFRDLADKIYTANHIEAVPAWREMHKAADEIERLREQVVTTDREASDV